MSDGQLLLYIVIGIALLLVLGSILLPALKESGRLSRGRPRPFNFEE